MRSFRRSLFAVLLPLTLAGCPVPPPRYPIREGATVLASIRSRESHAQSLRAKGTVEHYGKEGRVSGNIVLFVRRPDKLRVDTFAFGTLVSSMVSDGLHEGLLQDKKYYLGDAKPCVTAQLLGIALNGTDIVTVLTGSVPLIGTELPAPVWRDGRYVVTATNAQGDREEVRFELPANEHDAQPDQQHIRPSRVILSDARGVRLDVTYEHFRDVQGVAYPDRVRIQQPRENTDTIVRFEEIVPNFTIPPDPDMPELPPPDPFLVEPPAGSEVVGLACPGE